MDTEQQTQTDWPTHVNNWQASGLTQSEYCRRNDLKPYNFTYWKKRLTGRPEEDASIFVPLAPLPAAPLVELRVLDGLRIELKINLRLSWSGVLF